LGTTRQEPNGRVLIAVRDHKYVFHPPHTKDLTSEEVTQLRNFLEGAGVTPDSPDLASAEGADLESAPPDMVVVVDHHSARLYTIEGTSETARRLRPYDPHHFLHHPAHEQERELHGQREPEDPAYYSRMAAALAPARRIVLLGHGAGNSNAAAHFAQVLHTEHREISERIVATRTVDLSAITEPQLLALAVGLLRSDGRLS
jgi:hypothetical protein